MTDKQIIIDGVDVSGCEWFYKNDPCKNTCKYFCTPCEWVEIQNCMYKYAKRKEQECERLEYELVLKDVANIELSDEVKKYRKAIDEIEEIADNNYEIAEMEQIFLIIGGLDV